LTGATGGAEATTASASAAGEPDTSNHLNDLPFQVKIQYTDIEGAVAMRVLTQTQPVTKNRRQAEQCMLMKCLLLLSHFQYNSLDCISLVNFKGLNAWCDFIYYLLNSKFISALQASPGHDVKLHPHRVMSRA